MPNKIELRFQGDSLEILHPGLANPKINNKIGKGYILHY